MRTFSDGNQKLSVLIITQSGDAEYISKIAVLPLIKGTQEPNSGLDSQKATGLCNFKILVRFRFYE